MKLPWHTARNLNCIGGSMKRAQDICRGRERVKSFYKLFSTYIKMSKNSSAKYYQDNKEYKHAIFHYIKLKLQQKDINKENVT